MTDADAAARPDVDVVIVAYRSEDTIAAAVASVVGDPSVRSVIVVDNDSPDDSGRVAAGAGARVVAAGANRGFGAGCNVGVAASSAPFVLFLNPDAAIEPGTVAGLRDALLASPGTAAVGSEIRRPGGALDPSRRRRPNLLRAPLEPGLAGVVDERYYARRQPGGGEVDWVGGACFLVRRDAFEGVGGFDERYFLYAEEADLCARLRHAGWKIEWRPGLVTTHQWGHSTSTLAARGKLAWADGWMRYVSDHHPHPGTLRFALATGLYGRALVWRVAGRGDDARVWATVARHVASASFRDRAKTSPPRARNAVVARSPGAGRRRERAWNTSTAPQQSPPSS